MNSIRGYGGEVRVCLSCGQPCYLATEATTEGFEPGWSHFTEQWDGIHCPWFPFAWGTTGVGWDDQSLADVKRTYPDTYPHTV